MSFFGSLNLAYQLSIVLGGLILLSISAGFIKLLVNKRRLKIARKAEDLEAQGRTQDKVPLNARELDEGDLFGVRAIERGFFGGVAQSRPTSAASSHVQSMSISIVERPSQLHSTSSSVSEVSEVSEVNGTEKTANVRQSRQKLKKKLPSHLSLALQSSGSDTPFQSGSEKTESPDVYMPTSPRQIGGPINGSTIPGQTSNRSEVKIDSEKLASSPPQLEYQIEGISQFGEAFGDDFMFESKHGAAALVNARSASELSTDASQAYSGFPTLPPQAAYRDMQLLSSGPNMSRVNLVQLPTTTRPRPQRRLTDNDDNAQLRVDSSRRQSGVSVYLPTRSPISTGFSETETRTNLAGVFGSMPVSAMPETAEHNEASNEAQVPGRVEHSKKSSKESFKSIRRTQDSLKRRSNNNNKSSRDESQDRKRRSRDRDSVHYDPRPQLRNRSGSIQGRQVDFDRRRESPFGPPFGAAPQAWGDDGTAAAEDERRIAILPRAQMRAPQPSDPDDPTRPRGASDASQDSVRTSMGDFYDNYYDRRSAVPPPVQPKNPARQAVPEPYTSAARARRVSANLAGKGRIKFKGREVRE